MSQDKDRIADLWEWTKVNNPQAAMSIQGAARVTNMPVLEAFAIWILTQEQ